MNKDEQEENQVAVDAAVAASGQLAATNVAHCLVGRLGLLSHGYGDGSDQDEPIEEVHFLVDADAAYMKTGKGTENILVVKAALPIAVGGLKVRCSSFEEPWQFSVWKDDLSLPKKDGETPVGSIDLILCMMMMAGDDDVVAAAVADGAPADGALAILKKWEPDLAAGLVSIVGAAGR